MSSNEELRKICEEAEFSSEKAGTYFFTKDQINFVIDLIEKEKNGLSPKETITEQLVS